MAATFSNGHSGEQLVRVGQGKGARFKCAQSQLNWGSNDSIYALANLQLRLKCVCVCGKAKKLAAISGQTPKS